MEYYSAIKRDGISTPVRSRECNLARKGKKVLLLPYPGVEGALTLLMFPYPGRG